MGVLLLDQLPQVGPEPMSEGLWIGKVLLDWKAASANALLEALRQKDRANQASVRSLRAAFPGPA